MPVAAIMEGQATIQGMTETIKIEIDYSNFVEVNTSQNTFYLSWHQFYFF